MSRGSCAYFGGARSWSATALDITNVVPTFLGVFFKINVILSLLLIRNQYVCSLVKYSYALRSKPNNLPHCILAPFYKVQRMTLDFERSQKFQIVLKNLQFKNQSLSSVMVFIWSERSGRSRPPSKNVAKKYMHHR